MRPTGRTEPCRADFACSGLRSFAPIRFARAFDCRGDGIFSARCRVLAALDQIVGAIAQLLGLALRVIFAFIGFLGKEFARLFSGLRRKQNSNKRTDAEPHQKIRDFGTNIVRHENLHKNRSIGMKRAQYRLTSIGYSLWLSFGSTALNSSTIFSAVSRGMTLLNSSTPARRTMAPLPNSRKSFCAVRGPTPGMPSSADFVWRAARRWRWNVTAKRCVSSRICWMRCSTGE